MSITIHQSLLNDDITIITLGGTILYDKIKSINKRYYENHPTKYLLLDFRTANFDMVTSVNIEQIMNYVAIHAKKRPDGSKTALVTTKSLEIGLSRMAQIFSEIHNINVESKIFYDYQDAMKWFIEPKNRINLNSSDPSE